MSPAGAPTWPIVAASLCLGTGLALLPGIAVAAWDEFSVAHAQDCIRLARTVRITEAVIRHWLRLWGVALLGVPAAIWTVFGTPILVAIALPLTFGSLRWILGAVITRRRRRLRDQLVPASFALANAVRAGLSLSQAIELVGEAAVEPIRTEFLQLRREYESGRTLNQSLQEFADRLDLPGYRMFTAALLCCLEHGGPLPETLDQIAQAVQEDQRLHSKMEVASASGRMTLVLLSIFPAAFLVFTYVIEPEMAGAVFATWSGQLALLATLGLVFVAIRMGLKIIRIESVA